MRISTSRLSNWRVSMAVSVGLGQSLAANRKPALPCWSCGRDSRTRDYGSSFLGEYPDHDAAILRAAVPGLVRRNRLVLAVADHVHLVQRDLMLLVEVPLDGLGAFE